MKNKIKQKRRLRKSLARRQKEVNEERIARDWRNYWVKVGILKG